ncbi:hypothetical protein VaNZ11_004802 [Volvox africanus]|uniref:ADP-ribosylation factor-like protein 13B n=1 Tax=Volvox africanus TaxID=51714 RepID=A0ABQ5RYU9_9CHLO|nr:hypothetical protein VaNZ11_004802 [Volvox africanus]
MFGLLYNFYKFCKKKSERKITLALLGLDNAGKTTLLNTIKGQIQQETSPTFGFNSSTLDEGKYKIEVFDLGGGKTFRTVWSKYLAEVHAIVYVVDAADAPRFEESKKALQDVLECHYMRDKAILVFANKQDLPTASTVAEVAKGLGLATCRNSHNVIPCTAKTPADAAVDERLREGLRWLTGFVDREYGRLDARVQAEGEEVRQEEARKKKEREERLRRQREERLRQQKEEEERAREVERANALHNGQGPALLALPEDNQLEPLKGLHPPVMEQVEGKVQPLHQCIALGLPHTIESPGKPPVPRRVIGTSACDTDPSISDQGPVAGIHAVGASDGNSTPAQNLQPLAPRVNSPLRPCSAHTRISEGGTAGGSGIAPTVSTSAAAGRPTSAGRGGAGSAGGGSSSSSCSSPGRPASAGSRVEVSAAEGWDEAAGGNTHRQRIAKVSSGGLGTGVPSDGALRGSFSLVTQNNKVVPVAAGFVPDVPA